VKHLKLFDYYRYQYLLITNSIVIGLGAIAICITSFAPDLSAQIPISGYKPNIINSGVDINDTLTDKDIPTGQKGFARDYIIEVQKDDRLEITVNSQNFDTVLSLLDRKGEVIAENDDAAGENTNSLVFFKVRQAGSYTIRVSSFGGSSGGKFTLKATKLRAIN